MPSAGRAGNSGSKRVLVVGCGGWEVMSSSASPESAWSPCGGGDVFDETNLNRQHQFKHESWQTQDPGCPAAVSTQSIHWWKWKLSNSSLDENAVHSWMDVMWQSMPWIIFHRDSSYSDAGRLAFPWSWCSRWLDWAGVCRAARSGLAQFTLSSFQRILRVKSRKRAPCLSLLPLPLLAGCRDGKTPARQTRAAWKILELDLLNSSFVKNQTL